MSRRPPSTEPFSTHDWVKLMLDGGVFLLDNDAPEEGINYIYDGYLKLEMKSWHYLVSAPFEQDQRDM